MSRHRAQHRLRVQPAQPRLSPINPLIWLIPLAGAVIAGILAVALQFAGSPPATPQNAAAATTALSRPDPTTAPETRAFLAALAAEHVTIEPHQAVLVGHAVCEQRKLYNTSPFTLQAQIRTLAPGLRPIDVATLVDKAAQYLCRAEK